MYEKFMVHFVLRHKEGGEQTGNSNPLASHTTNRNAANRQALAWEREKLGDPQWHHRTKGTLNDTHSCQLSFSKRIHLVEIEETKKKKAFALLYAEERIQKNSYGARFVELASNFPRSASLLTHSSTCSEL
jgi:hypothetical protein